MENKLPRWYAAPVFCAALFSVIDLYWIMLVHVLSYLLSLNAEGRTKYLWEFYDIASATWRSLHFPLQLYLEPVFLPAVVSSPSDVTMGAIVAFELCCILQWTFVGVVAGVIYAFFWNLMPGPARGSERKCAKQGRDFRH